VLTLPGLGLDVDAPEDLAAILAERTDTDTRRLLESWRARLAPLTAKPSSQIATR